ncbi:nucleotidyltransferase family protein [Seongchinamella sediminis]|uniref:Nucleotidyltransferase family protein n=1 Tax=Seongchinamella sediminis TaxID=2283635 RepID=A0A3L7DYX6_9GAMM|nr:nucleotidyltransferase family protein [Seongchinamella sediminis]RLQ21062.1 nucleotidyltransferase family protein [Seongchinamella sediminis]
MTVGVLVLAAGRSRRFGADKRLALLPGGRALIDVFLDELRRSGLPALVCLDTEDRELAASVTERGFPVYRCRTASAGMGATLAEGASQLPDWDGVLIALADMPWVTADTYRAVADSLSPGLICVPTCNGRRGHPVGFGRCFFQPLAELGGDVGARELVQRHADRVVALAVADAGIHRDIDRPEDIERSIATGMPGRDG